MKAGVEIGFRLISAAFGRGIASEPGALIRHGFETSACRNRRRHRSGQQVRKRHSKRLGFKREGWRRAWGYDNHFFRLTKQRWRA